MPHLGLLQAQPGASWLSILTLFAPVLLIWYLLLIRPQQKQQAQHRRMLEALKPGDKVITSGGIHGTVVDVRQGTIGLRIAEKVRVEVSKSAVTGLRGDDGGDGKESS